jgi:tetratricopeptide (TPR) repeat protein
MANLSNQISKQFCMVAALLLAGALLMAQPAMAQEASEQARIEARQALNEGVQAYKNGEFDKAIAAFRRAKELDPSLLNARLYLATTYASLYIPGVPSEENVANGQKSVEEFKKVLSLVEKLPQGDERMGAELSAIDGIGSMLYNLAGTPFDRTKFDESKSYHKKHIEIWPSDPEPYYWVGVIDWTLAYKSNLSLRNDYNRNALSKLRDDEPLPPALRERYAPEYGSIVDEGIEDLKKAIALRPDYDDAMAYLNLIYRRKADMVASLAERDRFNRMADALVDRVMKIKQRKMTKQP